MNACAHFARGFAPCSTVYPARYNPGAPPPSASGSLGPLQPVGMHAHLAAVPGDQPDLRAGEPGAVDLHRSSGGGASEGACHGLVLSGVTSSQTQGVVALTLTACSMSMM